jgi:hypothetical protein
MQGPRRDACAPTQYAGQQSFLWRNLADGTFANVSDTAGILPGMRSLGTVTADLDRDGWLDWFVANDVHDNQLYWGGSQLPFDEGGMIAGVACSEIGERDGSMGTDIADFDGDGELDLFIANYAGQDRKPRLRQRDSSHWTRGAITALGQVCFVVRRFRSGWMAGSVHRKWTRFIRRARHTLFSTSPVVQERTGTEIHGSQRIGRSLFQHPTCWPRCRSGRSRQRRRS